MYISSARPTSIKAMVTGLDHAARDFAMIDGRPSSKGNVEGSIVRGVLNPVGSVSKQGGGKRGHGEAS